MNKSKKTKYGIISEVDTMKYRLLKSSKAERMLWLKLIRDYCPSVEAASRNNILKNIFYNTCIVINLNFSNKI